MSTLNRQGLFHINDHVNNDNAQNWEGNHDIFDFLLNACHHTDFRHTFIQTETQEYAHMCARQKEAKTWQVAENVTTNPTLLSLKISDIQL